MSQTIVSIASDSGAARPLLWAAGRSYAGRRLAAVLLPTAAGLLLLGLLLARWPGGRPTLLAGVVAVLAVAAWQLWPLRRLGPPAVARQLDRLFPELEDSAGLLLQDRAELPFLGQLQQQRVAQRLAELTATQAPLLPVYFKNSLIVSGLLLIGSALAWWLPARQPHT